MTARASTFAILLLLLPSCGDDVKYNVAHLDSREVVPPPSCGEISCYLAIRATHPDVRFEQIASTLAKHSPAREAGTSLLSIKDTLKEFRIDSTGIKGDIDSMISADCDLILHLNLDQGMQHFSYCEIRNREVILYDPIFGAGDQPTTITPRQLRRFTSGHMLQVKSTKNG